MVTEQNNPNAPETPAQVAAMHDAAIAARQYKIQKAVGEAAIQGDLPKIPHVMDLDLNMEDDVDPFGGNINNRKVARRIAAQKSLTWANPHALMHLGDPRKAMRDVERSEEVNPEAMSEQEIEARQKADLVKHLAGRKPTPGSPAAQSAANVENAVPPRQTAGPEESGESVVDRGRATAGTPNGPPVWNPNAGKVNK